MQTKQYLNTTDKDIDIIGIGVVAAGDRVTLVNPHSLPVLENYPGLEDVTDVPGPETAAFEDTYAALPQSEVNETETNTQTGEQTDGTN